MINAWTVLGRLKQISALDDEGTAIALPLCTSAVEEICKRLKNPKDEDNPRLIPAAASLAFYKLATYIACSEGNIISRKVGDISVTQNNSALLEMAASLRDDSFADIADLLVDNGFIFSKVGI